MNTNKNAPSPKKIGERIRAVRQSRGMTQSELAGSDITRNMLSCIENGSALPSLSTLCAIASRLDVPVGALLDDLEGYAAHKAENDMRALFNAGRFADAVEYYESSVQNKRADGISSLFCRCAVPRAWELYNAGELTQASALLTRVAEFSGEDDERIYILKTLIDSCPAVEHDSAAGQTQENETEHLRKVIFDKNDTAVYLYALKRLGNIAARPYSQPSEMAAPLLAELTPIISALSDGLYKAHIEAKFDMLSAEYLSAKAKLLKVVSQDIAPALLWAVYTDLEFCCKCCGDFENAYKYSTLRIELIKRIH